MPDVTTYQPPLPWLARTKDVLYGSCLAWTNGLTGGMVSGRLALAQALARMLDTVEGTNICDIDDGYDLAQHLHGRTRAADLSEAAARITTKFRRDDRVKDAQVTVSFTGEVLIVSSMIFDGDGPFPLTLSTSDFGILILKVGR